MHELDPWPLERRHHEQNRRKEGLQLKIAKGREYRSGSLTFQILRGTQEIRRKLEPDRGPARAKAFGAARALDEFKAREAEPLRSATSALPAARVSASPIMQTATFNSTGGGLLMTACGQFCMRRKKVNISNAPAGQKPGIKEMNDGIWLISFMSYDLGYIDLEQRTLQTIDNPFGTRL